MANVYGECLRKAFVGEFDWGSDVLQGRLMLSTYSLDEEETTMTPSAAHKVSGTTDAALTAAAPSKASGTLTLDITTNPTFASVSTGQDINAIIVYKFVTNDAGSTPAAYNNFTQITSNGSDITVTFNVLGSININY